MTRFLSLDELILDFGLIPEEISGEEYRDKAQNGWVEWIPEVSGEGFGHDLVAITPPGTSHLQKLVSCLCDQEMTLG